MKIKVCGLRDPRNLQEILQLPIDFVGFIFYSRSPRVVNDKKLPDWINKNGEQFGNIKRVGVFVNAEVDQILNAVHDYQLDYVQLHGNESPGYCREIKTYWEISSMRSAQVIKAFQVDEAFDFRDTQEYERHCALFVFDTRSQNFGGSGRPFDWQLLEQYTGMTPYLLSGGIDEDAAEAISKLNFKQMAGVDINSRFETSPGIKDVDKVGRFVAAVNRLSY